MDVSVRELRNHTGRVVKAIESGESVVLTVHGRAVADIVPRRTRSERRSSEVLGQELQELTEMAARLARSPDPADHDTGVTTDDMV